MKDPAQLPSEASSGVSPPTGPTEQDDTTHPPETTPDSPVPEATTSPLVSQPLRRSTREKKPVIRYPM